MKINVGNYQRSVYHI